MWQLVLISSMHKHSLKHPKSITYPVQIKVLLGLEDGLIGQRPSMQQAQERQQNHNNTLHSDCLWSKWSCEGPGLSLRPQDIDLLFMCATPPQNQSSKTNRTKVCLSACWLQTICALCSCLLWLKFRQIQHNATSILAWFYEIFQ